MYKLDLQATSLAMSKYSPSLMGGEGSGISQSDLDPKGQVTLSQDDKNLKSSEENTRNHEPSTPSLMNCSNVRFTYRPAEEKDEDIMDETEEDPYIPSPKPDAPKGNVNDK